MDVRSTRELASTVLARRGWGALLVSFAALTATSTAAQPASSIAINDPGTSISILDDHWRIDAAAFRPPLERSEVALLRAWSSASSLQLDTTNMFHARLVAAELDDPASTSLRAIAERVAKRRCLAPVTIEPVRWGTHAEPAFRIACSAPGFFGGDPIDLFVVRHSDGRALAIGSRNLSGGFPLESLSPGPGRAPEILEGAIRVRVCSAILQLPLPTSTRSLRIDRSDREIGAADVRAVPGLSLAVHRNAEPDGIADGSLRLHPLDERLELPFLGRRHDVRLDIPGPDGGSSGGATLSLGARCVGGSSVPDESLTISASVDYAEAMVPVHARALRRILGGARLRGNTASVEWLTPGRPDRPKRTRPLGWTVAAILIALAACGFGIGWERVEERRKSATVGGRRSSVGGRPTRDDS